MKNYSYSLAANDEATNVKYKICVLYFKHRIHFIKQFWMLISSKISHVMIYRYTITIDADN